MARIIRRKSSIINISGEQISTTSDKAKKPNSENIQQMAANTNLHIELGKPTTKQLTTTILPIYRNQTQVQKLLQTKKQ